MSEITLALEHPSLGCGEVIARYDLSEIQEKAYQQGRADAIQDIRVEIANKVSTRPTTEEAIEIWEDKYWLLIHLDKKLEQMQKGGRRIIMDEVNAMSFPNDFEEFIDDYSFIDKDEIYTNGSQLIPTFRVMQGYEHFVKQIRADAITECLQIVQKIKDDYNDARFGEQIPINYGTLCGIIIEMEQLKEQNNVE